MKLPVDIRESVSILNGDDLVNTAYEGLVSLMDMIKPDKQNIIGVYRYAGEDIHRRDGKKSRLIPSMSEWVAGLICGVYMPGSQRSYWCGNFDVGVDEFPKEGCVWVSPDENDGETFAFAHVKALQGFSEDIITQCPMPVARYRISKIGYMQNGSPFEHEEGCKIASRVSYFAVNQDGSIWSCHDRKKLRREWGASWSIHDDIYSGYHWGPGALSLLADRRFLWLVDTSEPLMHINWKAKLQFGVEPEMVKSLFYSRSIPLTATGRLKPILHWVEAHRRRIKSGIEIDINKYLRGTESFEMGGLNFDITSPTKRTQKG